MRITGGRARGIPIKADTKADLRPATDRMREAVFSSLGPLVEEARFLDLFAGTGAYGLEALSRGAISGVFVEQNRRCCACIQENLASVERSLGSSGGCTIRTADATTFAPDLPFDLVFADPPYARIAVYLPRILQCAQKALSGNPAGRLIIEMPGETLFEPTGWVLHRRLGKGKGQPTACILGLA